MYTDKPQRVYIISFLMRPSTFALDDSVNIIAPVKNGDVYPPLAFGIFFFSLFLSLRIGDISGPSYSK